MTIAPAAGHSNTYTHLQVKSLGAPSAPGIHDTLRSGVGPSAAQPTAAQTSAFPDSAHPLETRLKKWEETQDQLKMEGLRRTFGISEPIRRGMELKVVREGEWRPVVLGGNRKGVHEDILTGKDTSIEWEDVFMGEESRTLPNFHDEVEKKVRMQ
jgi:proteasome maturation protein